MVLGKGFAPLTLLLIGVIFTIALILLVVVFVFTFRYHVVSNLQLIYNYNNAELAFLTFMRSKFDTTSTGYDILAARKINGFDGNDRMKLFVEEKLNMTTLSNCYKLVDSRSTFFKVGNCDPTENVASFMFFIPYNPDSLIEEITLVYD